MLGINGAIAVVTIYHTTVDIERDSLKSHDYAKK